VEGTAPDDSYPYPGFALLDFPANLGQHTGLSDDENYLVPPTTKKDKEAYSLSEAERRTPTLRGPRLN
jgi:hypothetical protein